MSKAIDPVGAGEERKEAAGAAPRGVPGAWLVVGLLLLISFQNLLLWRFLGISSSWAYAAGALAAVGLAFAGLRSWVPGAPAPVSYRVLLFSFLIAGALLLLGGQGRFFYANLDWQVRDAVFRDLVLYPWPFVYLDRGQPELLRAPLGMYLTPAAIGKGLGLEAGGIAMLLQNILLTGSLLALASQLFETTRARIWALAIFLGFSGMDALGTLIVQAYNGAFGPLDHIEFWSGIQYSSHLTLLFWVPQHGLAGWIGALMFLLWRKEKVRLGIFLLAVPVLALWSPLAAMGTLPFATYAGLTELFRKRVGLFDIGWPLIAVTLAAPGLLYLMADGDSVGIHAQGLGLGQFSLFTSLEVLPLLAAVLILSSKRRLDVPAFAIVAACLLIIPFIRVGEAFDFMMRVSIPSLAILSVLIADAWSRQRLGALAPARRIAAYAVVLVLVIGAVTPLLELRRALIFLPPPMTECNLVNSMRQVVGLEQTSGATYYAALDEVPRVIRPRHPFLAREQAGPACWSRPWQARS